MFQKQRDFSILTAKENRCKDNLWHRPSCKRTQGICRCHIHHELYLLPPQQKDSNRLYHAIPIATLDDFFSGRAIKVRHSAKLRLPDATAFQLQWKLARSGLWHLHPCASQIKFWCLTWCFWHIIVIVHLRKSRLSQAGQGPIFGVLEMEKNIKKLHHQLPPTTKSEFSVFSKVTTYSPLNLLVQETMEQQKVPLVVQLTRRSDPLEGGTLLWGHLGTKCRSSGFHHKPWGEVELLKILPWNLKIFKEMRVEFYKFIDEINWNKYISTWPMRGLRGGFKMFTSGLPCATIHVKPKEKGMDHLK